MQKIQRGSCNPYPAYPSKDLHIHVHVVCRIFSYERINTEHLLINCNTYTVYYTFILPRPRYRGPPLSSMHQPTAKVRLRLQVTCTKAPSRSRPEDIFTHPQLYRPQNSISQPKMVKKRLREEGSNLCLRGDQITEVEFKSGALDHSAITDMSKSLSLNVYIPRVTWQRAEDHD